MQEFSETQRKALAGARAPWWQVTLLSKNDQPIKDLHIVGGSVELAPYEKLKGSASLELADVSGIDFLNQRVRITYHAGVPDIDPWSVGVFLFASPKEIVDEFGRVTYDVSLLTKLALLDTVELDSALSLDTGANLVEEAARLIRTVDSSVAYTPSSETVREPMTFPVGDNLLKVVNELLDAANYWSVNVSGEGAFILEPYSDPASREVVWEFRTDENSILSAETSLEQDITSVPNKIICHTSGTDDEPALVAVAINNDPTSPYSISSRGRVITKTYDVDASSLDVLQRQADRRLAEAVSPVATYEITHGIVPGLQGHDAVLLNYRQKDYKTTIQKMSMELTFDAQASTTLRRGK